MEVSTPTEIGHLVVHGAPGVGLSQDGLIELQATATYIIDQWGDPRNLERNGCFPEEHIYI